MLENFKKRESGVELLKIICIFIIILSHVVQTLGRNNSTDTSLFLYDFSLASTSITSIVLALFRHLGHVGTTIFFICSTWFMVGKEDWNNKKAIRLWVEVYFFSMLFLLFMAIIGQFNTIETSDIVRSFFPVFTLTNWYLSIYIAFALICPLINRLIKNIDLRIILIISIMLFALGYIVPKQSAQIPSFLGFYFFIYYLKNRNEKLCDKVWFNILIILLGLGIFALTFVGLNIYGLNTSEPKVNVLWQLFYGNLPYYIFGFGFFNLFRKLKFRNGLINYLSSTALVCYLVHENILLRAYVRTQIWDILYTRFGHSQLVVQSLLFAVSLFLVSLSVAIIYKLSLEKYLIKLGDLISSSIRKLNLKITKKLQRH